jgi:hypothetical protein
MIKVIYRGRLGNNLFQYALGRILAEEMEYELSTRPLPFPATKDRVEGSSYSSPEMTILRYHIDIPALIADKTKRAIILDGWFQCYKYYAPFWARIRHWFSLSTPPIYPININNDDLLIYVRLGDIYAAGWTLKYVFYKTAIEMARPKRIFICSDSTNHPFLEQFNEYAPVILTRDTIFDLNIARLFKKIVLSCSTFSWWAALLSEAAEIYFPLAEEGHWSHRSMQPPRCQQDLRINDQRFIYFYNCAVMSKNRNPVEAIPLSAARPAFHDLSRFHDNALAFHTQSKAFWFP